MPVGAVPQRTPLRRISQGSLFRLSRSGAYPDAPHGLGFLEPALSELVDEAEALHTNVQGLKSLSDALGTFNESFASWLYVMNMNALTTDWPQAWFIFSISAKIALYIEAEFSIMYRHPQARHSRLQRTEQVCVSPYLQLHGSLNYVSNKRKMLLQLWKQSRLRKLNPPRLLQKYQPAIRQP